MSIWCVSCKSHVNSPCVSHPQPGDNRQSLCRKSRSTKGASKVRRDHINHEIRNMRALLPIPQEEQERLSYLHSMATICAYIRKSVLFQGLPAGRRLHCSLPYEAFLQALHGFILVTTAQGWLVYVSENVTEYLGFSMLDVLQGDTLYDMVEQSDVGIVRSNLEMDNSSSPERSFVCHMQTSKAFKLQQGVCCSMLVTGRFQSFAGSFPKSFPGSSTRPPAAARRVFVALCTPTANRLPAASPQYCHSFSSTHGLDMSFTRVSDSVFPLLGYLAEEMPGWSWYSLVHPEDLSSCADSHRSLVQADEGFQVEMVLRLQRADLSWSWVYVRANKEAECQGISFTNFIISESEAYYLGGRSSSDASGQSPVPNSCQFAAPAPHSQSPGAGGFKRPRTPSSQEGERRIRARAEPERDACYLSGPSSRGDGSPASSGDSSTLVSPYSSASSGSPVEELGRELLMDAHEGADQALSSPESTLSYCSYPEAGFTYHQSPSDSLPVAAEPTFDQAAFSSLRAPSPLSSLSPTYDFRARTSDARLVPDCLSVSDMCESPADCALYPDDFSLLEQPQGGGLVQLPLVPQGDLSDLEGLLTSDQAPVSAGSNQFSEREQVEISILAQQISSLASSFDRHHGLNTLHCGDPPAASDALNPTCDWPHAPLGSSAPLPKHQLLTDGQFDSLLKDLDFGTRNINALGGPDMDPNVNPNVVPNMDPYMDSNVNPNVVPNMDPNTDPYVDPNMDPYVDPNVNPYVDPNVNPYVDPNVNPNVVPNMDPNTDPYVDPYSYQQGPACSRAVSQEQGSLGLMAEDQFGTGGVPVEANSVQLGDHSQNTGLHQLSHYVLSSLLQDGLAEENLYQSISL